MNEDANIADKIVGGNKEKYIFFDMGHDQTKVGIYDKKITSKFEYFMLPTQLWPEIQDDLNMSTLCKDHIDFATLKQLNDP